MDLATIKEENHIAPSTLISQVFAPRYITRSRAIAEVHELAVETKLASDSNNTTLAQGKFGAESGATTPSEWETASDSPLQSSIIAPLETPTSARQKELAASQLSSSNPSVRRKRGRHKEYTAPTGVWKTNGGYISTIYVGNRRIYGPLRDNPEEAGVDRQKLIEAKSFARTETEMRNFIATLKSGSATSRPVAVVNRAVEANPATPMSPPQKRRKPTLMTVTSTPTTIVVNEANTDDPNFDANSDRRKR